MIHYDQKLASYVSSLIPITHGFGTKQLGDGRLKELVIQQTHSTNIHILTNKQYLPIENCDGVITKVSDITLSVLTADCVPIIFYDPVELIVGISHQGWKGTLQGLPHRMINEMKQHGTKAANIICAIGPAINECCYEVSEDLAYKFVKEFTNNTNIVTKKNNTFFLNLLKTNYFELIESGILKNNIDFFPFCTSCKENEFWSFRRDMSIKGEMTSFVMLK